MEICGRLMTIGVGALVSSLVSSSVIARGPVKADDRWNPEHISGLPTEVRNAVLQMCRHEPRAEHYFATYFDSSRLIKLHFEHFRCDGGPSFCNPSGCLHVEYVWRRGRYQKLKSYYGPPDD